METDGSDCPEGGNSTDCLLRTLLHLLREQRQADDAETNWDPITLWLTLVIGVAAALIAVVTVLQAVLAGSKGRRRANERAIGRWSVHTKTHRNWRDMSVQSTTWTPVLRTDTLLKWHSKSKMESRDRDTTEKGRVEERRTFGSKLARLLRMFLLHRARREHPSAATWLELFDDFGLTDVNPPKDKSGLRQTVADYLPDDLIASPAYAQVGVIIAATATMGARFLYIQDEKRYPIILGRSFQFEFRQHPIIGAYGAYSRYGTAGSKSQTPGSETLSMAMQHARGIVETGHSDMKAFNLLGRHDRQSLQHHCRTSDPFSARLSFLFREIDIPENYLPMLSIFFFRTPKLGPAIFPTKALRTSLPLTTVALTGRYWKSLRLDKFSGPKWPSSIDPPRWPHGVWCGSKVLGDRSDDYPLATHIFDRESNISFLTSNVKELTSSVSKATMAAKEKRSKADGAKLAVTTATDAAREDLQLQHAKGDEEAAAEEKRLADRESDLRFVRANLRIETEKLQCHFTVAQMCIKFLDDPEKFLD